MVQMHRQNDPSAAIVASAVDKMTITNSGPTLHATFSITERKLEEVVGAEHKPGVAIAVDPGVLTKPTKP
jgi:hypothetical protein